MKFLKQRRWLSTTIAVLLLTLSPCSSRFPFLTLQSALAAELLTTTQVATNPPIRLAENLRQQNAPASYRPDVSFTLRTDIGEGKLIFAGQGGRIDGQANPDLNVKVGDVVQITLIDGDGAEHDITVPEGETNGWTGNGLSNPSASSQQSAN